MEEGTEGMLGGQWGRSATREGTVGLVEDSSATRAHQEHTGGIWVPIIPGDKGGSRCGGVPLRSWCYTNPPIPRSPADWSSPAQRIRGGGGRRWGLNSPSSQLSSSSPGSSGSSCSSNPSFSPPRDPPRTPRCPLGGSGTERSGTPPVPGGAGDSGLNEGLFLHRRT